MAELVTSERRGPVALLTLNRPDALNALNRALMTALRDRLDEVAEDAGVRALVLTGAGAAFAAGADIAEMRGLAPGEAEHFSRQGHGVVQALEALPIPTLAAVNGFALGGGCELACGCDWIYAARRARFGQPEVNLGLIPGFGGTSRLVRRVGVGWGRELVLSGELIGTEIAERIGLVNRVFADGDELIAASVAMGEKIASKGRLAVATAKRVILEGQDADVRVAHALEQAAFGGIFASEDSREGMDAFLEKRDPAFKDR